MAASIFITGGTLPGSFGVGDLLYGSVGAFAALPSVAAGQPLLSAGVNVAPTYSGISFYFDLVNTQLRIGNNPSTGLFFNGQGEFQARRESANATIRVVSVGASNNSFVAFDRTRGTIASPTRVLSGDTLGSVTATGYDGVSVSLTHGGQMNVSTTEDWDATHNGTKIQFNTIATGSTVLATSLALNGATATFAGTIATAAGVTYNLGALTTGSSGQTVDSTKFVTVTIGGVSTKLAVLT